MERITIQNRKGQKLAAIFHKPASETPKIIIYIHSFKCDKDEPIIRAFAKHICDEGYALIRFDCYGSGESDGRFEDSSIHTQVEDLQDIIAYAKNRGYTDICLAGLSLGTSGAIMAYDSYIKCMVLWSPIFRHDFLYEAYKTQVIHKGYAMAKRNIDGAFVKVGKSMWQDFKDVKPYEKLQDIKCPVLAIIGSKDTHISKEKARGFIKMIPKGKLEIIKGGDHDFLTEAAERQLVRLSADFLKGHF